MIPNPEALHQREREIGDLSPAAVDRQRVPAIHYEGWTHFREGREAIEAGLANGLEDVRERIRWLPIGVPTRLAA